MVVCPVCKKAFSIESDNIEPIYIAGEHAGWKHSDCAKEETNE